MDYFQALNEAEGRDVQEDSQGDKAETSTRDISSLKDVFREWRNEGADK